MVLSRIVPLVGIGSGFKNLTVSYMKMSKRLKTHFRSGAVKPMPRTTPFGVIGVICVMVSGLFIGAFISKIVANFLEEIELFVPSDDDDDN